MHRHYRDPDSIFFAVAEADWHACRRDTKAAGAVVARALPNVGGLRVLEWLFNYYAGLYRLCDLQWAEAGECFRRSFQVYVAVERRGTSVWPSMPQPVSQSEDSIPAAACPCLAKQ